MGDTRVRYLPLFELRTEYKMAATGSKAKVDVAPGVLTWARETVGLPVELAAKRLGLKVDTLTAMEAGVRTVTLGNLRKMAEHYDRPLIAFFLPAPPEEEETIPDFRVIEEGESRTWSPALVKAYRRAIGQRDVMLDLAESDEGDEQIPSIEVRIDPKIPAEAAAQIIRDWLSPPSIRSNSPYDHFNAWVSRVEDKGILVTQMSDVSIEEARGFSVGQFPLPVIALNGADFPRGKLFTLLHELVHILLHQSALCNLEDAPIPNVGNEGRRLEWYCNSVAAAVLMPGNAVIDAVNERRHEKLQWSSEELRDLATEFGVSTEAMLVRLVSLQLASRGEYQARRSVFLEQYQELRRNRTGFITYYNKQIRNLSRRYVEYVWRAYERGAVSETELGTYLNVKPQNVAKLIERADVA